MRDIFREKGWDIWDPFGAADRSLIKIFVIYIILLLFIIIFGGSKSYFIVIYNYFWGQKVLLQDISYFQGFSLLLLVQAFRNLVASWV